MGSGTEGIDDAKFVGAIPDIYERLLVPMIFRAPAVGLARLVGARAPADVLETAAGTGALTRELLRECPGAQITATDLNPPMLSAGAARTDPAAVTWQQADALDLGFADASFDIVACQFGVMFFPDRVAGYAEALRVLRPGGVFAFNTWDRIENNVVTHVIEEALAAAVPDSPIRFMSRTPHGYFSPDQVVADLHAAGFDEPQISAVDGIGRTTASEAAVAFCQGTPLRVAIEAHPTLTVPAATQIAEAALREHFGDGPIDGSIRWFEVIAESGSD
ncbi:SAM-dependent methyltransferase [Marmoricola sp. OAE513]|uniref:class I SAM-dependent methyltransferase n=1 Tax=Marmoricola sp. OAE513 TaxID=2817894 RepID=UPI001AEA6434